MSREAANAVALVTGSDSPYHTQVEVACMHARYCRLSNIPLPVLPAASVTPTVGDGRMGQPLHVPVPVYSLGISTAIYEGSTYLELGHMWSFGSPLATLGGVLFIPARFPLPARCTSSTSWRHTQPGPFRPMPCGGGAPDMPLACRTCRAGGALPSPAGRRRRAEYRLQAQRCD